MNQQNSEFKKEATALIAEHRDVIESLALKGNSWEKACAGVFLETTEGQ
jgi:hypothetical protein